MRGFIKKLSSVLLALLMITSVVAPAVSADDTQNLSILFVHDSHDYLYPTSNMYGGKIVEHGGAAKLATVIKENKGENTLFLDAGDFSMGTLYQAAYSTDAYELRNLGICGCSVTTFGNHEFDYGAKGAAQMLRSAIASGDKLPQIVQSNIDLSGELTEEQLDFKKACEEYGVKENTVIECAGKKIGIMGLVGISTIACIQTDFEYIDYIKAAKKQVSKLQKEGCDMIIALSHSGTDGEKGEDVDLAKKVPGIDVIISGHTHSTLSKPLMVGETAIVSCGEYLKNVGKLTVSFSGDKMNVEDYKLIPLDSSVKEDPETKERFEKYKEEINKSYLEEGETFDKVIAHSNFDFIGLDEMYATHQEYPLGDLIADSYIYEAEQNGINDIDVALVGLGTVRGSFEKGDITVADAFEICSLGVGSDGTAGHPLVACYLYGWELKLLTEIDASVGELVSSLKLSYSGLNYSFNSKRLILSKVIGADIVKDGKAPAKIEDKKLYKVVGNVYAINMLDMVHQYTKGILSIAPRDENGKKTFDFYSLAMKDKNGGEIKEWIAFKDYLASFEKGASGYPEIPDCYASQQGRKVKLNQSLIDEIKENGFIPTIVSVFNSVKNTTVSLANLLLRK